MIGSRRKVRVTVALLGTIFTAGGATAAATGTLPAPAQNFVSDAAYQVGLSLPAAGESLRRTVHTGEEMQLIVVPDAAAEGGFPSQSGELQDNGSTTTTVG